MELIIFASLNQNKEVLYFYTHLLLKNFLFTCWAECHCIPFILRSPRTLSGAALRAGFEMLNPTSSGCIRVSHRIVMLKRSFQGPLEGSFCGLSISDGLYWPVEVDVPEAITKRTLRPSGLNHFGRFRLAAQR